ncbi:MAG: hydroxyisourate hydrolase [Pseudomonadota bacterium]
MATISSHVLNAVDGSHAAGIQVDCFKRAADGSLEPVFSITSEADGRIAAEVPMSAADAGQEYELVFHTGVYFDARGPAEANRLIRTAVYRLHLHDPDARYHVPIIASPHGYSTWWST